MTPPWGTPWSLGAHSPPSRTPASSHCRSSFSIRRSLTRFATSFMSTAWSIWSKNAAMSASTTQFAPRFTAWRISLHRLVGTPLRPEPVRAVPKVRLEDRLQHHLRGGLDHPIPHRRDPQRPLLPVCLRDEHPPHRLRPVPSLPQLGRQLRQEPLDPAAARCRSMVCPSTPAAPALAFTSRHARAKMSSRYTLS